ncbi:hypothetical protein [Winogradskyella sp.]|uniref:hypothetical protein n=1 Tax=Winogradskyella sp. TaxID=1883156 RepID=UPI003BA8F0A6
MNKLKYIAALFVLTLAMGCDTNEPDSILPSSFDYIAFENTQITTNEANAETVVTNLILSSSNLSQDRTFQYTLTFPEGEQPAVEGVDFSLPSNFGTITMPAGESRIEVALLQVINNDVSSGSRYVSFTLQEVDGFLGGEPDDRTYTTVVRIDEDDLFEFGYTSFEEVPTFDVYERYPKPFEDTDPLPNIQDSDPNAMNPYVTWTNTTNELGFTAAYTNSADDDIQNEEIGVYNNTVASTEFPTTFIDGNQAYVTSDLDGLLTLTFDEVVGLTPNVQNAIIEIKVYFEVTSWESTDGIAVYFETEDGLGDPIISIFDDDVEDAEGVWQELQVPIPEDRLQTGRLIVTMFNGASTEAIFLDYLSIKGIL